MSKSEIPKDRLREVTYERIMVAYKPNKLEPNRSRLKVGGNRLICIYDVSTPTADVTTIKMLWNCHFHTRRKVLYARHLQLLLRNAHEKARIYVDADQDHPAGNY